MKQYTSIENTPMIFHKIFCYILIPLSFLSTFGNLLNTLPLLADIFWFALIDIAFYIIAIIFLGFIFYNALTQSPKTANVILAYYSFIVAYYIIAITIYFIIIPDEIWVMIGQLFGQLVYGVLVYIYYYKRIPAFEASLKTKTEPIEDIETDKNSSVIIEQTTAIVTEPEPVLTPAEPQNEEKIRTKCKYCFNCGAELKENANFCDQCGANISN